MKSEPLDFDAYLAVGNNPKRKRYPAPRVGRKQGLSKGGNQTPQQREVEASFVALLSQNWGRAKSLYRAAAIEVFGTHRLIDLDLARTLSGVYKTRQQRFQNLMPTNGPSAQLTDEILDDYLNMNARKGKDTVLYLMGVGCSGKTTVARKILAGDGDYYHAIFTRVTSQPKQVKSVMRRILKSGKRVNMRLVLRKPEEIVDARIEKALKSGETEPLHQVALRYGDCLLAAEATIERYQKHPDPRVSVGVYTNFGGQVRLVTDDALKVLAEIKRSIPNSAPLTGNPAENAANFKKALVFYFYERFAAYDRKHPEGTDGHLPKGGLRDAVFGNKEDGVRRINSDFYGTQTLADLEKAGAIGSSRPKRAAVKAGLRPVL